MGRIVDLISGIFGRRPDRTSGSPGYDPEVEIQAEVEAQVAAGYSARDEIVSHVMDVFEDEGVDEADIRSRVDAAILAYARDEARWTRSTDCDRLDEAFAGLEELGIVARQNFSCCGSCGSSEIGEEIRIARAEGRGILGYTFFHVQDTESAVAGGGVYLSYGTALKGGGRKESIAVGRLIVDELRNRGLSVDWNGSLSTRILVEMDWKRRRAGIDG